MADVPFDVHQRIVAPQEFFVFASRHVVKSVEREYDLLPRSQQAFFGFFECVGRHQVPIEVFHLGGSIGADLQRSDFIVIHHLEEFVHALDICFGGTDQMTYGLCVLVFVVKIVLVASLAQTHGRAVLQHQRVGQKVVHLLCLFYARTLAPRYTRTSSPVVITSDGRLYRRSGGIPFSQQGLAPCVKHLVELFGRFSIGLVLLHDFLELDVSDVPQRGVGVVGLDGVEGLDGDAVRVFIVAFVELPECNVWPANGVGSSSQFKCLVVVVHGIDAFLPNFCYVSLAGMVAHHAAVERGVVVHQLF